MPERNTHDLATLLAEAMQRPPGERAEFLTRVCAGDADLRRDLDDLLAAHEQAGDFLQHAAIPTGMVHAAAGGEAMQHDVGTRIGPYKILQLIGEGGFGSVFMAEQEQPVRRRVALKIIKWGMDTRQVIARFEAERQALAIMDHPSIARVFDAGATITGRPYFAMELVKGEPITEYCDRHRLAVDARLNLFQQVCSAVQHAHQKGVIHRDIKPSNVLVTLHDGNPQPKVIDFGIAKATSARLTEKTLFTEFRQLIGTPEYMSPEQAEANATDIDTRSDVYSLGVLLYELLTGSTPFDGRRLRSAAFGEMQRIIREEDPPRPSTRLSTIERLPTVASQRAVEPARLRSELRGDLDWIVMRAIEKDRTRRYESASALADDIRRHMSDEPVLAGSPGPTYRLGKFIRRHRAQVVAGSIIALALIGGSVGTLIGMLRARESEVLARAEASKALAVNDFMNEVLTSVEPDERGADVRLVEVIDDASRTASDRFAGHPELEAQVRQTLSQVYGRLSNKSAQRQELQKVLEIWRQVSGPDDRRAVAAHLHLIDQIVGYEETTLAEAGLAEVGPRVAKVSSVNGPLALEFRRLQAMAAMLRGRYDEAEGMLRDVRERLRAAGDNDQQQLAVLEGLVSIQRRRFHESDATRHDATALATMEPLVRESIERSSRAYGPDAVQTLDARLRLADIEWQQGRCLAAAQACRAVLQQTHVRYVECDLVRDYARYVLSFALNCLGETREPADLWLDRIACRKAAGGGSPDPVYLGVVSDSLRFLERDNRGPEGEALARELADALNALGGGHDAMAFAAEIHVAGFVSMQGRIDEAGELFTRLFQRPPAPATQVDESAARARLHLLFARHLTRQGRYEESEVALQTAVTLIGDLGMGTYESHPDDMILAHIELYEAWNKPDRVSEYRAMLLRMREQSQSTAVDQPPADAGP